MIATVKARRLGDSVVITLTKPILESAQISEGDSLQLETVSVGRVVIAKEGTMVSMPEKIQLEIELVERRKEEIESEIQLAIHEHNMNMPTVHPGIEDDSIMEGAMREWQFRLRQFDVEIAQKRLQLFDLRGR